jgi:hypothetical protein
MNFSRYSLGVAAIAATTFSVPAAALTVDEYEDAYLSSTVCLTTAIDPNASECGGVFEGNNVGNGSGGSAPGEALTEEYIANRWGITADGVTYESPEDANGEAGVGFEFDLGGTIEGSFVVAVKQSGGFTLFYYEESAPVDSLTYLGYGGTGLLNADISHFTVYGSVTPPIPEPSTYALMLAGLGVVGWMARRRRPV